MTEDIKNELNKKDEPSELTQALLTRAKNLVKLSRGEMAKFYPDWDLQDQVYRGERALDEEDLDQERREKPTKMIVPNTFAQIESGVSFLFLMFNQNRTFFELTPTGDEDAGYKHKDIELILERDLRRNRWNSVLYQNLTDIFRFGPGILDCEWYRKTAHLKVQQPSQIINIGGSEMETRPGSEWQEFVKYEGNRVRAVSPYRFFPDTRLPLTEFERGEFCAYEEEYSMSDLRSMAANGDVAGVENIQPLSNTWSEERGYATRSVADFTQTYGASGTIYSGNSEKEGPVIITKVKMWIVPAKFEYGSKKKKLGPEEHRVLYHVWYANDNTVIRCEPAQEWHNSFGMTVSQFTPDMHHTLNLGLANLVYRLQDVMSFLINSHIKEVRRNVGGRLVVNVDAVEARSLDGEGDVYLKKGFGRRNANEAVVPLPGSNVTNGHMGDSQLLNGIMQMISGINDNMSGQYNGGRRSAQESRVVTAGAAGRMKLHGHLIWDSGYSPLAQMMTSNSRQSLSLEQFMRVVGKGAMDPARFAAFQGTPEEIINGDDFFNFDSTMASEKGFMAQSLQDLLSTILTVNPQAALQIAQKLDPTKMIDEIQYLRGGGNTSRFMYEPGMEPQMAAPQTAAPEMINNPA